MTPIDAGPAPVYSPPRGLLPSLYPVSAVSTLEKVDIRRPFGETAVGIFHLVIWAVSTVRVSRVCLPIGGHSAYTRHINACAKGLTSFKRPLSLPQFPTRFHQALYTQVPLRPARHIPPAAICKQPAPGRSLLVTEDAPAAGDIRTPEAVMDHGNVKTDAAITTRRHASVGAAWGGAAGQ